MKRKAEDRNNKKAAVPVKKAALARPEAEEKAAPAMPEAAEEQAAPAAAEESEEKQAIEEQAPAMREVAETSKKLALHISTCKKLLKHLQTSKVAQVVPLDPEEFTKGLQSFAYWCSAWRKDAHMFPATAAQEENHTVGLLATLGAVPGLSVVPISRDSEKVLGPDLVLVTRDRLFFVQCKYAKSKTKQVKNLIVAGQKEDMIKTAAWFRHNHPGKVDCLYLFYERANPISLHYCHAQDEVGLRTVGELPLFTAAALLGE